ncbi:MAG: GTP-binding protein [Candidatus Aminicenantes bacterium]|nr:GTP-binding protein [Candidatus Aminicenantes bacterium]
MTKLIILNLSGNQITDLTPLRELKHLKRLNVRKNNIQRLPPGITSWWPGMEMKWEDIYVSSGFNIYGNPLMYPPVEIVKKGKATIENYFAEIQQASVLFLESKLLLVGSGDVGKTTLMNKLKDKDFLVVEGKQGTTRGIDIQPWQLSCPFSEGQARDVKIHFWDFGGQDILHVTHQFFLTKRSLYLFVWDPRKEEETRSFDYWLNAVKLFGAGSPLIMVMNKADQRIKHIDEASFQDKFPNIARFHQISCVTGQHIPELTQTIRRTLCGMPHLLDKLPKRWMDIRDELKARKDDYITQEDYFAVCRSHDMDREKALFLSDYLHDLGIILHFHQDPVLAGTVILKPEWATGAVYALIDSLEIQQNKGRFSRSNLDNYWNAPKFPAEKYPQLLRLMEKFELCFQIVDSDNYILPELLPPEEPGKLFDNLVTITSQLQGINKTLQTDENSRNTVVSLLLRTRGFHTLDQTLWGLSATGERIGELDIKIEDTTGRAVSIIEALNLDKYDTSKIDSHVRKLFHNYDCSGLKENYILVYASAKNFADLCRKYRGHPPQIDYNPYPLLKDGVEVVSTGLNKVAAFRARHRCNDGETILYHLLVEM